MKKLLLVGSHGLAIALGFALGVYFLPVLIAPPAPTDATVSALAAQASFKGEFRRDLKDSDALHWGEGKVSVSRNAVALLGALAPGPDYRLYLSPEFVDTETDFNRIKDRMVQVGDVRTFRNFLVPVPEAVVPARYNTVVVWCEAFGQFITAAKYR